LKVAAEVLRLEERCVMTTIQGIPMPTSGFQPMASDVMFQNGVTSHVKLITIYNNGDTMEFPILEGENSATQVVNPNNYSNVLPTYDHSETGISPNNKYAWNEEFRVYVGYNSGGTNYFGLPAHSYVTVPVPMAIWDSGRLQLVEDTASTRSFFLSSTNPFNYHSDAHEFVQSISSFQSATYIPNPNSNPPCTVVQDPMILFYHAGGLANGIANDAPSQLTEFTIRDTTTPTSPVYPVASVSFDYDLSYLDAMYLPVSLEALGGTNPQGKKTQFGYVGTTLPYDKFESTVQAFVSGSLLNGYLGAGKGWPQYYTADPQKPPILTPFKIPGGNNVFQESANGTSYPTATPYNNLTSSQPTDTLPGTNGNYAVDAIANLWFSWAKYYKTQVNTSATPTPVFAKLMEATNLKTFDIQTGDATDVSRARAFSQTVWDVMNEFTTVPMFPPAGQLLPTSKLMQFILGDVQTNQSVTDQVIALMRGVPNNSYSSTLWYPTPGDPTTAGLAKYNLNPFVWLVHTPSNWDGQRIYAYAYSVDDAFGNILVPNTGSLLVTISGPTGLKNTKPYDPSGGQSPSVSSTSVQAAIAVPAGPKASSALGTLSVAGTRTESAGNRSASTLKAALPSGAISLLRRAAHQQDRLAALSRKAFFGSNGQLLAE
jgi:hypothetical protein